MFKETPYLFKSFTRKDRKRFMYFLQSPYFNTNERVTALFSEIMKSSYQVGKQNITKEILYVKIYQNNKYNDSTMRNLFYRLRELLKKFLAIENYSKKDYMMWNSLLNELNVRKDTLLFSKSLKEFESCRVLTRGIDEDYFYSKYHLEVNKFNFYNLHDFTSKRKSIYNKIETINKASFYLYLSFITELICNYLNLELLLNEYHIKNFRDVITGVVQNINLDGIFKLLAGTDENDFVLKLYMNLFKCFSEFENEDFYYLYKNLVKSSLNKLSKDEISFHYSRLISYCILKRKQNKNLSKFRIELFNLYNEFLNKEFYKDNKIDYLPHNLYRNILFLALELGELKWVEKFVKKYSANVEPELIENMFNYGHSFVFYYTGQYILSLNHIKKIKLDYFIYKYDVRYLEICINFELDNRKKFHA